MCVCVVCCVDVKIIYDVVLLLWVLLCDDAVPCAVQNLLLLLGLFFVCGGLLGVVVDDMTC